MPVLTCQQCQYAAPIGTEYYCTNPDSAAHDTIIALTDETCEEFEHIFGESTYK